MLTVHVYMLASAALVERAWYLIESRLLSQGAGRKLMSNVSRVLQCSFPGARAAAVVSTGNLPGEICGPSSRCEFDVIVMTKTKMLARQSAVIWTTQNRKAPWSMTSWFACP